MGDRNSLFGTPGVDMGGNYPRPGKKRHHNVKHALLIGTGAVLVSRAIKQPSRTNVVVMLLFVGLLLAIYVGIPIAVVSTWGGGGVTLPVVTASDLPVAGNSGPSVSRGPVPQVYIDLPPPATAEVEPEYISLDSGSDEMVDGLVWSKWGANSALGTGDVQNSPYSTYDGGADVTLSKPVTTHQGTFFTLLTLNGAKNDANQVMSQVMQWYLVPGDSITAVPQGQVVPYPQLALSSNDQNNLTNINSHPDYP